MDDGSRCVVVLGSNEALVRGRPDVDHAPDQRASDGVPWEARQNLPVLVGVAGVGGGAARRRSHNKVDLLDGVAVLLAEVEICAGGAGVLGRHIVHTSAEGKLAGEAGRICENCVRSRRREVSELVLADGGVEGRRGRDGGRRHDRHDATLVLGGAPIVVGGLPESADVAVDVSVETPEVFREGQVVQRRFEEQRAVAKEPERLVVNGRCVSVCHVRGVCSGVLSVSAEQPRCAGPRPPPERDKRFALNTKNDFRRHREKGNGEKWGKIGKNSRKKKWRYRARDTMAFRAIQGIHMYDVGEIGRKRAS